MLTKRHSILGMGLLWFMIGASLASAQIVNGNFETGDLTGWTATGDAFTNQPAKDNAQYSGTTTNIFGPWEGTYRVNTWFGTGSEAATGELQSDAFTLDKPVLSFMLCGYANVPGEAQNWTWVSIHKASDGSELTRFYPNNTNNLETTTWDGSAYVGQKLYIKVVDNGNGGGYAWISVDRFRTSAAPVVGKDIQNGNFETGTLDSWTATGDAFSAWNGDNSGQISGWEGTWRADTFHNGEAKTGTLRSATFTVTKSTLKFLIGGWRNANTGSSNDYNYVTVNLADDGSELARVYAPNQNALTQASVDLSAVQDQDVYIEIVDNANGTGYAWIEVDDFYLINHVNDTLVNPGFEKGDFTGWTIVDNAYLPLADSTNHANATGWAGNYFVNTAIIGESAKIELKSDPFILTSSSISFLFAGWKNENTGSTPSWNYVALKLAKNDEEISRVWAPNGDIMVKMMLTGPDYVGQAVYIDIVDDCNKTGFAWMAVDDFQLTESVAGDATIENSSFETGDLTGWTATGEAFSTNPVSSNYGLAAITGWVGAFYANSRDAGEAKVGSLRSKTFKLQTPQIQFLIDGYQNNPTDGSSAKTWNYVTLNLASSGAELARVWPPNSDTMRRAVLDGGGANVGQDVYIEVVDSAAADAYAWLGVDHFQHVTHDTFSWLYEAVQAETAPVIDGKLSTYEWLSDPLVMDNTNMAQMGGHTAASWVGDYNRSAMMWMAWDATWFYFAAKVVDDVVVNLKNQGEALNGTDVVQLCLDHQNLKSGDQNTAGITIHDIAPGTVSNANQAAYWQHWPNEVGYPGSFSHTQFASSYTSNGYVVEMAIKWSDMTNPITPAVGKQLGYLALLMDFDTGDTAAADLWWNQSGDAGVIGSPALWQTLTLVGSVPTPNAAHSWSLYE